MLSQSKTLARVAVFDGTTYQIFNAETGESGLRKISSFGLIMAPPLLDITGGTNATVKLFTMMHHNIDAVQAGMRIFKSPCR